MARRVDSLKTADVELQLFAEGVESEHYRLERYCRWTSRRTEDELTSWNAWLSIKHAKPQLPPGWYSIGEPGVRIYFIWTWRHVGDLPMVCGIYEQMSLFIHYPGVTIQEVRGHSPWQVCADLSRSLAAGLGPTSPHELMRAFDDEVRSPASLPTRPGLRVLPPPDEVS